MGNDTQKTELIINRDVHDRERVSYDGPVIITGNVGRNALIIAKTGRVDIEGVVMSGVSIQALNASSSRIPISLNIQRQVEREYKDSTAVKKRLSELTQPKGVRIKGRIQDGVEIETDSHVEFADAGERLFIKTRESVRGNNVGDDATIQASRIELKNLGAHADLLAEEIVVNNVGPGGNLVGKNIETGHVHPSVNIDHNAEAIAVKNRQSGFEGGTG